MRVGRAGTPEMKFAQTVSEREPIHARREDIRPPILAPVVLRPNAEQTGVQNDMADAADPVCVEIEPCAGIVVVRPAADLDAAGASILEAVGLVVSPVRFDGEGAVRRHRAPFRRRLPEIKTGTDGRIANAERAFAAGFPRAGEDSVAFGVNTHVHIGIVADCPRPSERIAGVEFHAGILTVGSVMARLSVDESQPLPRGKGNQSLLKEEMRNGRAGTVFHIAKVGKKPA